MGAAPDMFEAANGKPLSFRDAVVSGRATGVPGAIAMLALAQKEHGRLPWASLFGSAEKLASDGFIKPLAAGCDRPEGRPPDLAPGCHRLFRSRTAAAIARATV